MPEWLFRIYAVMQPRLYAEELIDQMALAQVTNGRRVDDNDYRNFRRDLQLRADGGRMPRGARPKSLEALSRLAGLTVAPANPDVTKGGVVLPAGASV